MLNDVKVKSAKGNDKPHKPTDGQGSYLLVATQGRKPWRFKSRFNSKEKVRTCDTYPEISLADALKQLANDIDPGEVYKAQKKATLAVTEKHFSWYA